MMYVDKLPCSKSRCLFLSLCMPTAAAKTLFITLSMVGFDIIISLKIR